VLRSKEGGYSRDLAFIAPAKFEHARRSATLITQRFWGGISRTRSANSATSSRDRFRWTRFVDAGCFARGTLGYRSLTGRIGRGANPPPQFGQTLSSIFSTHSAQKVHSYEQIRASTASGGKSLSQYSQLGLSSSIGVSFHTERALPLPRRLLAEAAAREGVPGSRVGRLAEDRPQLTRIL